MAFSSASLLFFAATSSSSVGFVADGGGATAEASGGCSCFLPVIRGGWPLKSLSCESSRVNIV